jgi:uncharacterized protein YndB with AHSA1/START domain
MNNDVKTGKQELVLERTFNAPRDLVFKVWTTPEHLAKWWGPKDYSNLVCELELRPGGIIHIEMHGPDGVVIPVNGTFEDIVPLERLVFTTTGFEDEQGNAQLEVRNTVTFEDINGKTKLVLRSLVVKATSVVALPLSHMAEGWNESLDRLTEVLKMRY